MRTIDQAGKFLGALEERVMGLLWERGSASVREMAARLGDELAYTTVMTTLDRLFKKGLLAREREGAAFVYRTAMTRDAYHRRVVEAAVTPLLESSGEPVLAALVDAAAGVDERNLDRLEALIEAPRKNR